MSQKLKVKFTKGFLKDHKGRKQRLAKLWRKRVEWAKGYLGDFVEKQKLKDKYNPLI